MATKNKKAANKFFTVENAIDTVTLVNTVALTTTETVFAKGFETIERWQSATDKYVKKGFKFSAKQHDVVFDALEDSKEKVAKMYTKVSKKFAKKSA